MMAKPEMSMTRLYELVDVDALRGLVFPRARRKGVKPGRPLGTLNCRGYLIFKLDGRFYQAHRVIWAFMHGSWPSRAMHIDHINRDRTDNRLSNLREVTNQQNSMNVVEPLAHNKLGVRGVHFANGKFRARFRINGRQYDLGGYLTPEEASQAYEKARREAFPEHAPKEAK